MQITENTVALLKPVIKGLVTACALTQTEASKVIRILQDSANTNTCESQPQKAPMLTAKQVGERLGVCVRTVLRMRIAGQLKGVRLTGSVKSLRFPETEISKFIDGNN